MTRPRSNALVQGDPRTPTWMQPQYAMPVPNGAGPYHPDPSGYRVFYGTRTQPTEGWKFHVSAHPWNAEQIGAVLLPLLTQRDVFHKYLEPPKLATRQGNEVGKFIAYYPVSPRDAHDIAAAIDTAMAQPQLARLTGPTIDHELPFGTCGLLYARYGSYQYTSIQGPPGTNTYSADPARGLRAYHTGRIRPSWIPDLLQDTSATAFPRYDARRTLRGLPESGVQWVN